MPGTNATPFPAAASASTSTRPFAYNDQTLGIDSVPLPVLAAEHGTPLYLYSAANIRHRFALFDTAFAFIPHTVCYAVKANSSLAILQMLAHRGSGFDIVSGGELERVRRAHPLALSKVVFSGVGKQPWEIDAALQADILLFNVESIGELELLAHRAQTMRKQARFALRVNPDVFAETHPYISTGLRDHKFGVDIALARDLYRQAAAHSSLLAAGVSVHIGSQIRSVEPFAQAVARVAALVQDLRSDGHPIAYVDVGGGLGIDYDSPLPSDNASESTPQPGHVDASRGDSGDGIESQTVGKATDTFVAVLTPEQQVAAYAEALLPILTGLGCHLLLEPGRFLVAQAGGLLTRVLGVKQNGAKRFVVTDAAMNDLIRPALYQAHHEILPVTLLSSFGQGRDAVEEVVDVVGPVCESGDFFAHDRSLPPFKTGDLALLLDAGAYGMSQASNYNTRVRPAELLVDSGVAHLVRRRETLDDLLAPESLLDVV